MSKQYTPQPKPPSDIDRLIAAIDRLTAAVAQIASALPKPLARG